MTDETINSFNRILAVMAHPDDAELSSGGSIARWISEGKRVDYVICTSGDKGTKDFSMSPHTLAEMREEEQKAAAKVLGVERVIFLRHRDGTLEPNMAFRNQLGTLIRELKPDVVITHDPWRRYLIHPDHRAVGITMVDAIVSARDHLFMPELWELGLNPHEPGEILFTFPDEPDLFVDITSTMDVKIEAVAQHKSQIKDMERWEERFREFAAKRAEGRGFQFAEAFKRVVL